MFKKNTCLLFLLFQVFIFSFNNFSQEVSAQKSTSQAQQIPYYFPAQDEYVKHILRTIHSAEQGYQAISPTGDFGTIGHLQAAGFIDPNLFVNQTYDFGEKYDYRFTLNVNYKSVTRLPSFELRATPILKRAKMLSFYINENCEIRGGNKYGREANINDPVIDSCDTSQRARFERLSIASLKNLYDAELAYQASYGAGEFGSSSQLFQAYAYSQNQYSTGFLINAYYAGYKCTIKTTSRTADAPPHFEIQVAPQEYGRTGIKSFYINETGVLRGADKQGQPANANDPPITR